MANKQTSGNCYICGKTMKRLAMKKHILAEHIAQGNQECLLLEANSAHCKDYWLYLDIEKNKTLEALDHFLRDIWLECCGHLSAFRVGRDKISMKTKLGNIPPGAVISYEYDFGTTTELSIAFLARTRRPAQRTPVRLLARNEPFGFKCASCGKTADYICQECIWESESPFLCQSCADGHEHDCLLPITNSPRCGECGYDGELDTFAFDPSQFQQP
jgi:hypothetical protein